MKCIALLSSMPFESDKVLASLKSIRETKVAGKTIYSGKLQGSDCLLLNTGMGKVNAAHSATLVREKFPVKKIVNMGVGGAYPGSGLNIGDVAIATKEVYGDEGVIDSYGWHSLKKTGIPLVQKKNKKYFNEYPIKISSISPLQGMIKTWSEEVKEEFRVLSGSFVTLSAVTGTGVRAAELEKRFKAVCENMEGAAIAQVCSIYEIPFFEIRGISNIAGVRDKRKWNFRLAAKNCQEAVIKIINLLV